MNTALKYEVEEHALKIESVEGLTLDVANDIEQVLRDIAIELISNLACRRYDGFIPHSWNKGGIESNGYSTLDMIVGSGCYSGSDKFNDLLEEHYNERYDEILKEFKEELDILRDDFYERFDASFCSEYDSINVNYQGRYLGFENGMHTISLNIFLGFLDAPYFRKSDDDMEIVIEFKSTKTKKFKKDIDKAIKKMQDFIGSIELY